MPDMSDAQLRKAPRFARDPETGKAITVAGDMSYAEWYEKFVEGKGKTPDTPQRPMLHTYDDPIREYLGSAFDSHPNETQNIIDELKNLNVNIVYRSGTMGYKTNPTPGAPGQFVIDPEASYSAWLHERRHVYDDKETGWFGFRNFMNLNNAVQFEGEVQS